MKILKKLSLLVALLVPLLFTSCGGGSSSCSAPAIFFGLVAANVCGNGSAVKSQPTPAVFATVTTFVGTSNSHGSPDGTLFFDSPWNLAVDSLGNVYVTGGMGSQVVRKISAIGVVTTFAGMEGPPLSQGSFADGIGTAARFQNPTGIAVDSNDNVYVADNLNQTIRKITSAGAVTTLAGSAGFAGSADGTGTSARFKNPEGIAVDSNGSVYVADFGNATIRKITSAGVVTTIAGTAGVKGSADGNGAAAKFQEPYGVAVDASGNVFVADASNRTIRKISSAGVVTTFAGTAGSYGSVDGTGASAKFGSPYGVAVDSSGDVYVADNSNSTIRKITSSGIVTTIAGTASSTGLTDGTGANARFKYPHGVAVDLSGNVYVADLANSAIRKITSTGVVTTIVGSYALWGFDISSSGSADGTGIDTKFKSPTGIAVDINGNVYVGDYGNATIRKITAAAVVTTMAGTVGSWGSTDGTGAAAKFYITHGVAADSAGNVYVADTGNYTIRKITSAGFVTTLAGIAGSVGSADGNGVDARFNNPSGVAVDSNGNVYVADTENATIRKITAAGVVTTLAGTAGSIGSADGTGAVARLYYPYGVAVDSSGNVYVADTLNHSVRKITSNGLVTTLAGTSGSWGSADGAGADAKFDYPVGVAVDSSGNVYVADWGNATIRKITSAGVVSTIAGIKGFRGSADGTNVDAKFGYPWGIAVDSTGQILYVTDIYQNTIRKIILMP